MVGGAAAALGTGAAGREPLDPELVRRLDRAETTFTLSEPPAVENIKPESAGAAVQ